MRVLANWPVQPEEIEVIRAEWPAACEVLFGPQLSEEELVAVAPTLDVIAGQVPAKPLEAATALRFIHVLGHGIDRLGEGAVAALLRERRVPIARANPAANTIAEYVVMSLIALNRRLIRIHEALAYRGDWSLDLLPGRLRGSMGGELEGTTLTIAGLGGIGQTIARRAAAFGMRVGALTRRPERYDADALGLAFVGSLDEPEEWLRRSNHLVIALPLTEGTRLFLNADRFATLPEGALLVNIGRAAMVDQKALFDALGSGRLAGAAIDVWPDEPARTYPSPYPIHHFNVIMTPHNCAVTRESRIRALRAVGENLRRSLEGLPLLDASGVDG